MTSCLSSRRDELAKPLFIRSDWRAWVMDRPCQREAVDDTDASVMTSCGGCLSLHRYHRAMHFKYFLSRKLYRVLRDDFGLDMQRPEKERGEKGDGLLADEVSPPLVMVAGLGDASQ